MASLRTQTSGFLQGHHSYPSILGQYHLSLAERLESKATACFDLVDVSDASKHCCEDCSNPNQSWQDENYNWGVASLFNHPANDSHPAPLAEYSNIATLCAPITLWQHSVESPLKLAFGLVIWFAKPSNLNWPSITVSQFPWSPLHLLTSAEIVQPMRWNTSLRMMPLTAKQHWSLGSSPFHGVR